TIIARGIDQWLRSRAPFIGIGSHISGPGSGFHIEREPSFKIKVVTRSIVNDGCRHRRRNRVVADRNLERRTDTALTSYGTWQSLACDNIVVANRNRRSRRAVVGQYFPTGTA